jgi:hypothetical protein
MAKSKWLPGKREEKINLANLWFIVLSEVNPTPDGGEQTNAAAWGVPEILVADLGPLVGRCQTLLAKIKDPETATKVLRASCRAEVKTLTKSLQSLHKYFYLDEFPKGVLSRLGQVPRDETHSPRPKPTQYVSFEIIVYVKDHRIFIKYRIADSTTKGKGTYHAAEIRLWILPIDAPAPATAEAAGWQSFASTATPWEKTFDAEDIGKRLYIAMRWENGSTGKDGDSDEGKGPWSAIQTIIIP